MTATTAQASEFDAAFIAGFGQLLGSADSADTWKWNVAFGAGDTAIVASALPSSPESVIALMSYGVSDDPTNSDSTIGLQVTTRAAGADPRATQRLTSKVYDLLHGLTDVVLPGGVYVVQCYRQSWTSIGQDSNSRWRDTSNFYVTVHRPGKYRI